MCKFLAGFRSPSINCYVYYVYCVNWLLIVDYRRDV